METNRTSSKYTFIDDYVVEHVQNAEKVVKKAEKYPGNPVLIPDRDWEGKNIHIYGTVIYDSEEELFKMWYSSHHYVDGTTYNLYATSEDGINWTKPNLGLISYNGSKDNNLFAVQSKRGMHLCSVVKLDEGPKPYRLFGYDGRVRGLSLYTSEDGVNWTDFPDNPVISGKRVSDVWNVVYDHNQKMYIATGKLNTSAGRSVSINLSEDGVHWEPATKLILEGTPKDCWLGALKSERLWWNPPYYSNVPVSVNKPDQPLEDRSQRGGQIYGMPAFPYEDLYVGLVWAYHANALMETQLAWSRDCISWKRDPRRTTVIERGIQGAFDSKMIMGTSTRPLLVNDELWVYYGGWDVRHWYPVSKHTPWKGAAIGLAKWRKDGFVAMANAAGGNPKLTTSGHEGIVTTVPVEITGDSLNINADATGGTVYVEVYNPGGTEMQGFTGEDCIKIEDKDGTALPVAWKNRGLSELKGQKVKLRFHLFNAELYSFEIG